MCFMCVCMCVRAYTCAWIPAIDLHAHNRNTNKYGTVAEFYQAEIHTTLTKLCQIKNWM